MIGNYRKWAEQLAEAGVDIKSVIKPVEFIFQQAKEKGVHLDFWQICCAIWFVRKTQTWDLTLRPPSERKKRAGDN